MDVGKPNIFPKMLVMIGVNTGMAVYDSFYMYSIFISIYSLPMVLNHIRTFSYKYMMYFECYSHVPVLPLLPIPCPVSSHCSSRSVIIPIKRKVSWSCSFIHSFVHSFTLSFILSFPLLFLESKLIAQQSSGLLS